MANIEELLNAADHHDKHTSNKVTAALVRDLAAALRGERQTCKGLDKKYGAANMYAQLVIQERDELYAENAKFRKELRDTQDNLGTLGSENERCWKERDQLREENAKWREISRQDDELIEAKEARIGELQEKNARLERELVLQSEHSTDIAREKAEAETLLGGSAKRV